MSVSDEQLFNVVCGLVGQGNILVLNVDLITKLGGDKNSALLLGQILYWHRKMPNREWIYKKDTEWMEELFLTQHELRKSKDKLRGLGLIVTIIKRVAGDPILHYKIDISVLSEFLTNSRFCATHRNVPVPHTDSYNRDYITETTKERKRSTRKKPRVCESEPTTPAPKRTTSVTPLKRSYALYNKIKDKPSTREEVIAAWFFEEFTDLRNEAHPPLSDQQISDGLKIIKEQVIDNGIDEDDYLVEISKLHFRNRISREMGYDYRFPLFVLRLPRYVEITLERVK